MPRPHPARALGRAQVFAHRGGSALRPENTLLAFDHGLALGADGLEFDVHLSRDGVVVVHHDTTLDRTTSGSGPLATVSLGSFGTRVLRAARAREPRIVTGASREETRLALYGSWIHWRVPPVYDAFQVPELSGSTRVVSERFVRYAHDRGVAVQVWTVDEEADMRRLLAWGVDGIISDRPDVAVRVVRSHPSASADSVAPS